MPDICSQCGEGHPDYAHSLYLKLIAKNEAKKLIAEYKNLLQLEFPEDVAHLIIAAEDEILRRMATPASTARTDGWVSVEDGLPKTTGVYGIYPPEQIDKDQGLNFSPRYFFANEDRNTYVGNKLAYGWVKDKNHKVTHWRELPAAPGSVPQAPKRPTIVVLCGSTRFYSYFQEANYRETMAGKIVLSIGFYPRDGKHNESVGCTPEQKIALDELYFRKIELADEVLVLNVGGYMGESTTREVAYAAKLGKKINYLEAGVPQAEPPKEGE